MWNFLQKMDSDEEEFTFEKKRPILYGSLEEREKQRLTSQRTTGSLSSDAIEAGKAAGNINITQGKQLTLLFMISKCYWTRLEFYKGIYFKCIKVSTATKHNKDKV